MRYVHPAAIAGLLLNFALAWFLFSILERFDLSLLQPEDRATMSAIIDAIFAIRPVYYALLAVQAVALGLIVLRVRFAMFLAAFSAFFMLPGSLIYLIGCALTNSRTKYGAYATAPAQIYANTRFLYPSAMAPKARIATGVAVVAALGALLLGSADIGVIMFGMSLAGFYCALRAARSHALALRDDDFVITPELFAPRIIIRYADVDTATLGDDDRIIFDIHGTEGPGRLVWSLRNLEPKDRRAAVEELGAALVAHHVRLR